MESKSWYKSKACWSGIITVVLSMYLQLQAHLAFGCGGSELPFDLDGYPCVRIPDIPPSLIAIFGVSGFYGRVVAKSKITK